MNESVENRELKPGTKGKECGSGFVVVILLAILALGAYARFDNLGEFSFWTDELYHVVAARSVNDAGEPIVPGKGVYWRAYPVTAMTAFAFSHLGVSEGSARAPFVLVNLLFLVAFFLLIRRLFSPSIALMATFVLALSPHELQLAREVRMYSLFQLFYVTGSFLFFYALELRRHEVAHVRSVVSKHLLGILPFRITLFLGAGLLFLVAFWLQPLAVNFGLAVAAYCLVMMACLAYRMNVLTALISRYSMILAVLFSSIGIIWLVQPSLMGYFIEVAREKPAWDTHVDGYAYYSWLFLYYYPGFTFIYPLGVVLLTRNYGRKGLFVACAFLPLMIAHTSFYTGRVAERYITYIFPFFVIGACGVLEPLIAEGRKRLSSRWKSGSRFITAIIVLTVLPLMGLYTYPWLGEGINVTRWGMGPRWKEMSPLLEDISEDHVILTTWPREVYYYGGKFPDYILTKGYEYDGNGDHDVKIGDERVEVQYIRNSEQLKERLESGERLCVVATDWSFNNPDFLDDPMRDVVRAAMVQLRHGFDDRILVFLSPEEER